MMKRAIHIKKQQRLAIIIVLCLMLLPLAPKQARAQTCEIGTVAFAGGVNVAVKAILAAMQTLVIEGWETQFDQLNSSIEGYQNNMRRNSDGTGVLDAMDKFWDEWEKSLKDMTAERVASIENQSRQEGSVNDNAKIAKTVKKIQKAELAAKKELEPVEEGCVFDTKSTYVAESTRVFKGMQSGLAADLTKMVTNRSGTPAAIGPRGVAKNRWENFKTYFCDPASNAGRPAGPNANDCQSNQTPELINAHIMPSKTFFGKETLDLSDEGHRAAVSELIYNITGLRAPEPIPGDTLSKVSGKQQRQVDREYAAQADVISALPAMIVAERTPGAEAPEVKATRDKVLGIGSNASERPSDREIRQSKIEELWNPDYFARLSGNAKSIAEKELYLQALNVAQLYRLLEKSETIFTVYAAQTGNLLRATNTSSGGAMERSNARRQPAP